MAVVVERDPSSADCLVFTWPSTVPPAAEVVCGPDEVAVVCSNWQIDGELGPGRHALQLSPPLLQAAIYFVRTAAVSVPFGSAVAVIDRGSGQVVQIRFEGSLLCRVADPALLCWQVVGVPVRDLDAGVLRSVRASADKILHRVIGKACMEQPVASVINPVMLGEIVRRTVEANPASIAVTGIEFLQFEALSLALPTGVSTSWRPSMTPMHGARAAQFGDGEPTEEQAALDTGGEPSRAGGDAGSPRRPARTEHGLAVAVAGEIPDRSAQARAARGARDAGPASAPAPGAAGPDAAGASGQPAAGAAQGPTRGPGAPAGQPGHAGADGGPRGPDEPDSSAAAPARAASPALPGLDGQASDPGAPGSRPRRATTPAAGAPPPTPRRRTPPLGSLAAPLPPAVPRQPARHDAPTVKSPVLSPAMLADAPAADAGPFPQGSQVLVYGIDGLWHAATVRQYLNGQYEVFVGDSSTVAWVPASRVRS